MADSPYPSSGVPAVSLHHRSRTPTISVDFLIITKSELEEIPNLTPEREL
jgi:hypothetical protein